MGAQAPGAHGSDGLVNTTETQKPLDNLGGEHGIYLLSAFLDGLSETIPAYLAAGPSVAGQIARRGLIMRVVSPRSAPGSHEMRGSVSALTFPFIARERAIGY